MKSRGMRRSFILAITVVLGWSLPADGQHSEIRFHHIGNEEGLSHSLVGSIAEDSLGFLWFGTQDGLNRFDGYSFKNYYKGQSNRNPSDSWVSDLYLDGSNQLWINYAGAGIERFDPYTETFHPYLPDPLAQGSISSNSLVSGSPGMSLSYFEDSDGILWIGTVNGLNRYHRESDSFTVYRHDPEDQGSLSDNRIVTVFEDRDGFLWVGTENGLNRMDRSTGTVRRCRTGLNGDIHLNDHKITCGFSAPDGSIWVGTEHGGLNIIEDPFEEECRVITLVNTPLNPNLLPTIFSILRTSSGEMLVASEHGLYRIHMKGGRYEEQLITETSGIRIIKLLEDSKGYIWAASNENKDRSLFRLSPDLGSVEVFRTRSKDPFMFGGAKVMDLHESRTGLLWIGTEKHGIYRVDLNARQFRTIDNYPDRGLFITNNEVYSIFEDDDRLLYVGTKTELNRVDLKSGATRGYHNQLDLKRGVSYEVSSHLPANLIGVLKEAPDGKLWMGSFDYKVSLYDPVRDRFLNFHLNEQDLLPALVHAIDLCDP
jgi:ligand-binding sensor domain-containing protein